MVTFIILTVTLYHATYVEPGALSKPLELGHAVALVWVLAFDVVLLQIAARYKQ